MQDFVSFLNYLKEMSIWFWVIAITLIGIFLFFIIKSGWHPKKLKKVKVGPVEAERFEPISKNPDLPKESIEDSVSSDNIHVRVEDNTFKGKVGDIGGVIIKGNQESKKK